MARIIDLATLAKTSIDNNDFFVISNTAGSTSKKVNAAGLFPSLVTAGTGSEALFSSITNKNQLNFKGIKSGDTSLLTVSTVSDNIVLTALESGIDLSLCNNTTSQFMTGVDFTSTVTGVNPVTNGGTGLETISKGAVLYASANDVIAGTSAMSTNGQLLIGNATTGIPSLATITGGTNVTVTNSAGGISIEASLGTMAANLDMGPSTTYNIDLTNGAGYLSGDGTDEGVTVDNDGKVFMGVDANKAFNNALTLDNGISFVANAPTIQPAATTGGTAGLALSLKAGDSASAAAGQVNITAGTASGNAAGGSIVLTAGRDTSGSADGTISFRTYTSATPTTALSIAAEGQDVTIDTGNLIMGSKGIYMNSSVGDIVKFQGNPANTADDTSVISAADVKTGIVTCTPTADRTKGTDTASNLISGLNLNTNGDSWDFSLISLATDGTSDITISAGSGVTLVGNMKVKSQDDADDAGYAGVGRFRVRRTTASAVTIYRIG